MTPPERTTSWRKSTFSDPNECVEVAWPGESALVRDSKNVHGPVLRFDQERFEVFVAGCQNRVATP